MKNALFYEKLGDGIVRCKLCPHLCIIKEGTRGTCRVRKNKGGDLYTEIFEKVSSYGVDPIEKKPLYHFYPGTEILSIGAIGCNLRCSFCQNYRISQISPDDFENFKLFTAEEIINKALSINKNIGIAFTYNEPGTFFEYMVEISKLAIENNLKTVMVTNGYINREPLDQLLPLIDAFNIDLKAFSEGFYKDITKAKLAPVKNSIKRVADSGNHLEITNLVIPGLNDDYEEFEEMVKWIAEEIGKNTPFHISRYFPYFQKNIEATPVNTLLELYEISIKYLNYVYLGNVTDYDRGSTYCPSCNTAVITRQSYYTKLVALNKKGDCTNCGHHIIDYLIN
jgi:pyruvate formate lyase activating enzyme